ncbi:MAG TPA: site-2 protease family protein [Terriglobales bacterium]|nr:site-2 protease family protein [Terriglobales bacterium]
MRNWSFPAGRMFGVEIRVHMTFLLLLAFVALTEGATGEVGPGRAFALVGIIFLSVVIHELAHALAALHSGRPVKSVILLPLGGVTLMDETAHDQPNTAREIRIAAIGPIANLLIAFVGGAILNAVSPELGLTQAPWVHSGHLLRSLIWVNFLIGAINLLPAYPLDGGRIVRAYLLRSMDPMRATRRAVMITQMFSMAFILAGFWRSTWLVLVGFFLFVAAQIEERSAVFHAVLENVRLEDIMLTDFATLSPADTLEQALDKAVHSLQDDFPVVRGGDLVGVISKQRILEALRSGGNGYVQPVMNRLFEVGGKSESLAIAFRKITSRGLTLIPVVDEDRLVGIVTLQNLMHSMALLAETRKLRRAQ